MNKINWKQIWQQSWPHLCVILLFHVLLLVYFAPEVFNNKQLPQGDVISSLGWGKMLACTMRQQVSMQIGLMVCSVACLITMPIQLLPKAFS